MKTIALPSALGVLFAVCLHAAPAMSLSTYTYMSIHGNDSNPCIETLPCRFLPTAHTNTSDGGQIVCLDSGYFGFANITKSITIDCTGHAAVVETVIIGTAGINVRLRNLSFDGRGTVSVGINFTNGNALFVENCTIFGYNGGSGHGISFRPNSGTAQLYVTDSVIEGNGLFAGSGGGIFIQPSGSGSVRATLDRVRVNSNIHGIVADGTGTSGSIVVQVNDSIITGQAGNGVWAKRAGVVVDRSSSKSNAGYGVLADGPGALIVLGNSSVIGNGGGLGAAGGGSIQSYGNNQTKGNGFDGAPTSVLSLN